jgi:hypothetical protein
MSTRPNWQPPLRITKAEVPNQTGAMSKLDKLAKEVRANNLKLTTAQAFSKVLGTSAGLTLYREDRNERLEPGSPDPAVGVKCRLML